MSQCPHAASLHKEVGRRAKGPGRVYLVGGATALLLDIRPQTVDIDIKLAPEPAGIFDAIADLKTKLQINIELAAPDEFIPPLPGWETRSEFVARHGLVDFFHYDYYSQALAKVERGREQDLKDAKALVELGKIEVPRLRELFESVKPELKRYPRVNIDEFSRQVDHFCGATL